MVEHINPYLICAPDVLIASRSKPISDALPMVYGNKPTDDGNFILTSEEATEIAQKEPFISKFIRKYIGSVEYINGKERYCLWLVDATPAEIRQSKTLSQRVEAVRLFRQNSSAAPTRQKADCPNLFFFISQPKNSYILVPRVSSQNRKYIPMGFMGASVIASDSCSIIPEGTLYEFGVLISNVHMAWMRTVAGRLKSDYRYSGSVVYNNFPWPTPTEEQRIQIQQTAKAILDARTLYPDSCLADLYADAYMPSELRNAHRANDLAVMKAYGMPIKETDSYSDIR